ncbi:hypothetical protein BCR33DRAFT_720742 [Rhizoclosmatium globosum]|uniref:U-box domain-containing protein n=1 Tax=Rhizoclosmatium globosum TaxID=329046 RepID=A0A1Y2BUF3_9FUNG|nr:hypothetical protein BCR33DRAFT_720742 [Rhizoclosmatium globosum]|eukprot:ORY38376.1 hypothetical protein BCR33DRAFT_720742 [Rhizoclosmatium globosum]
MNENLLRTLRCPISLELFTDPVIAQDGYTYERAAIKSWWARRRRINAEGQIKSPMTGQVLCSATVIPNLAGNMDKLGLVSDHVNTKLLESSANRHWTNISLSFINFFCCICLVIYFILNQDSSLVSSI